MPDTITLTREEYEDLVDARDHANAMREIATGAGVATGAAYYYFDSKDAIVLAFYDQAQQEMQPLLTAITEKIHHTHPNYDLEPLVAQTFRNVPGVKEVQNGVGG